jgi:MFS family permease
LDQQIAPVYGPIIGDFVYQYIGWRWTNWLVLIIGGGVLAPVCFIKETYAPAILRKRAERLQKEKGRSEWWTRYDSGGNLSAWLKTGFIRPFAMLATEPIW